MDDLDLVADINAQDDDGASPRQPAEPRGTDGRRTAIRVLVGLGWCSL
jgi:hypothetical protein